MVPFRKVRLGQYTSPLYREMTDRPLTELILNSFLAYLAPKEHQWAVSLYSDKGATREEVLNHCNAMWFTGEQVMHRVIRKEIKKPMIWTPSANTDDWKVNAAQKKLIDECLPLFGDMALLTDSPYGLNSWIPDGMNPEQPFYIFTMENTSAIIDFIGAKLTNEEVAEIKNAITYEYAARELLKQAAVAKGILK